MAVEATWDDGTAREDTANLFARSAKSLRLLAAKGVGIADSVGNRLRDMAQELDVYAGTVGADRRRDVS